MTDTDARIAKAVEKDIQKYLTDKLTPDRDRATPIANVRALLDELTAERIQRAVIVYTIPELLLDALIDAANATARLFSLGGQHVLVRAVRDMETYCRVQDSARDVE